MNKEIRSVSEKTVIRLKNISILEDGLHQMWLILNGIIRKYGFWELKKKSN